MYFALRLIVLVLLTVTVAALLQEARGNIDYATYLLSEEDKKTIRGGEDCKVASFTTCVHNESACEYTECDEENLDPLEIPTCLEEESTEPNSQGYPTVKTAASGKCDTKYLPGVHCWIHYYCYVECEFNFDAEWVCESSGILSAYSGDAIPTAPDGGNCPNCLPNMADRLPAKLRPLAQINGLTVH